MRALRMRMIDDRRASYDIGNKLEAIWKQKAES